MRRKSPPLLEETLLVQQFGGDCLSDLEREKVNKFITEHQAGPKFERKHFGV